MAEVILKNLSKLYGEVVVVRNVDLTIRDGEFLVLVGPSGCGKSTTLRMIAGLEEISAGDLLIDGKRVNQVHPKDRDIAMVFQSYALYPHMNVRDNMGFGLKMRGLERAEIDRRVEGAAETMIYVRMGKQLVAVRQDAEQQVRVGDRLALMADLTRAHLFAADTGETIF
jgi:multiple sugar transport system ATP-binding protein